MHLLTSLVYVLPSDLVAELPFILMHPKPEEEDYDAMLRFDVTGASATKRISNAARSRSIVGANAGGDGPTSSDDIAATEDASHNLIQLDG